ncbi:Uncharacterized protein PECH_006533 [Penicillium ucsense]|uniref:Uncharacterized protein n=1 Tax=Penicillium ucsense TaxID=2839758 RepID=A0A8J8WJP1_9EURO|nr:Uncharacterized protein PECM_006051 [Penicillium ucsense]KAF7735531.1 Uncharacterized protein PECH_006533 [Penicillium ucsense]
MTKLRKLVRRVRGHQLSASHHSAENKNGFPSKIKHTVKCIRERLPNLRNVERNARDIRSIYPNEPLEESRYSSSLSGVTTGSYQDSDSNVTGSMEPTEIDSECDVQDLPALERMNATRSHHGSLHVRWTSLPRVVENQYKPLFYEAKNIWSPWPVIRLMSPSDASTASTALRTPPALAPKQRNSEAGHPNASFSLKQTEGNKASLTSQFGFTFVTKELRLPHFRPGRSLTRMFRRRITPRDQGHTSERTEEKKAAMPKSSASSGQPSLKACPRFDLLTGRPDPEKRPRVQTHHEGSVSDTSLTRGHQRPVSRLPRPLGRIFIPPPDLGLSETFGVNKRETGTTADAFQSGSDGEKMIAVAAKAVRTIQASSSEPSPTAIEQSQWERYGPTLKISKNANKYLGGPVKGGHALSSPTLLRGSMSTQSLIPRKPVPIHPHSSSHKPIIRETASLATLPRSWTVNAFQQGVAEVSSTSIPLRVPVTASWSEQDLPGQNKMTRSHTNVHLGESHPSSVVSLRSQLFKDGRAKLRDFSFKGTKHGRKSFKDSGIKISSPLEATAAAPSEIPTVGPCLLKQSAMLALEISPIQILADISPTSPLPKQVLDSALQPTKSDIVVQIDIAPAFPILEPVPNELTRSESSVEAETAPSSVAQMPPACERPATALTPSIEISDEDEDEDRLPLPRSLEDLTQCVNRLGKRLIDEPDREQRKKLYAHLTRLSSVRTDLMSREGFLDELRTLSLTIRSEMSMRRIGAIINAATLYREDRILRRIDAPSDEIVRQW